MTLVLGHAECLPSPSTGWVQVWHATNARCAYTSPIAVNEVCVRLLSSD